MTVTEQTAGAEEFAQRVGRMLFPATAESARPLTFLALPSARSTRYLVPARPGPAAAAMIGRQIIGGRPRTRVVRRVAMVAMRSRLGGRLWPSRVTVPDGPASVLGWLSQRLGAQVSICVGVGRPRANRKPVLQVTDPHGRLLGFAKVGHNALTRTLVRDEGMALQRLSQAPMATVVVPRLIAQEPWNDLELLLMSPLRLPATASTGVSDRGLLERAVAEIAGVSGVETRAWSDHPLRARVVAALDELGSRATALRPGLELMDELDPTLAFGSWHGDLNPGNLAVVGDRLAVWDWERFEALAILACDGPVRSRGTRPRCRALPDQLGQCRRPKRPVNDRAARSRPGGRPARGPSAGSVGALVRVRLCGDRQPRCDRDRGRGQGNPSLS